MQKKWEIYKSNLDQSGSSGAGGSLSILKVEKTDLTDAFAVGCKKMKEVKDNSEVLAWTPEG